MPIDLKNGSAICLDKALTQLTIYLGWDLLQGGAALDLDTSVAGLTADSKLLTNDWFVFHNNLQAPGGCITHLGYGQSGAGDQVERCFKVDLTKVPSQIVTILVIVSIHTAENSFADLRNAYLRVINAATGVETHRLELHQFSNNRCMVLIEINRNARNQWEIRPVCLGAPSLNVLFENIQVDEEGAK